MGPKLERAEFNDGSKSIPPPVPVVARILAQARASPVSCSFPALSNCPVIVKGRVDASAIVIEEAGEVEGELHAASIDIKGRFKGQVTGGKVRLHTSARVTGNITYESLSIESGAEVEGQCRANSVSQGQEAGRSGQRISR